MTIQTTPVTTNSTPSITPVRVLLVDDSPAFLSSAVNFLADEAWINIAGCLHSGAEAIHKVDEFKPDLVLMDLQMPGMNGLEATRQIKARPSAPRVIIITLHDDADYGAMAKAVDADGFISKAEFGAKLLDAIQEMFGLHLTTTTT